MAQTVRIEFLHLSVAGPINLIKAVEAPSIDGFAVTHTVHSANLQVILQVFAHTRKVYQGRNANG